MRKECKIRKVTERFAVGRPEEFSKEGYRVTIPNEMGSSEVFVEHLSEAFSLIGKYDNEAEDIERRAKRISDYLTSEEGAWGR